MSSGPRRRGFARVVRPTRRGAAIGIAGLVVIAAGYAFGRTELLFTGWLAVLLPVAAMVFVRLRRVRMAVTRSFSPLMPVAGRSTVGTIELRNLSSYTSAEASWLEVVPWAPFATPFVRLPPLPADRSSRGAAATGFRYEMVPPRRGLFDIGPLVVELRDPFALARSEVSIGGTQRIVVIPEIERLSSSGLSVTADDGSARAQRLRALGGDDDVMTRNYRTGDALRRVHWRASAHRGELMVREEEQRSHAEARIVLDTTRRGYPDGVARPEPHRPQSESFEWALKITATLALHLEQRGFLVQLAETGPRQLAPPERVDEFLESIAAATLCPAAATAPASMRVDSRPDRSLGVIFAVIADAGEATIESLIAQRRHFELAVALIVSPRLDGLAERLGQAGWRCVRAPQADSVGSLWAVVAPLLEPGHARR